RGDAVAAQRRGARHVAPLARGSTRAGGDGIPRPSARARCDHDARLRPRAPHGLDPRRSRRRGTTGRRPRRARAAAEEGRMIPGFVEAEVATLVRAVAGEVPDRDAVLDRFARARWSGIAEPGDADAGRLIATVGAAAAIDLLTEGAAAMSAAAGG